MIRSLLGLLRRICSSTNRTLAKMVLVCIICTAVIVGSVHSVVHAHLTGIFLFFLKDMEEETYSTRFLHQQKEDVLLRIEELEPLVAAAREEYEQAARPVADRMLFYDAYVGSALGALLTGSHDLVEAAANLLMLRKVLERDIAAIEDTSKAYARVQLQQRSLQAHLDLLNEIELLSNAREERLQKAPPDVDEVYGKQFVLYRMSEDWEWMRDHAFLDYFDWANKQLQPAERLVDKVPGASDTWVLQEETLNRAIGGSQGRNMSAVRIFLRADHIYISGIIHGREDDYRILSVGVIERAGSTAVQYRVEAIYLDGYPVDPSDPDVKDDVYGSPLLYLDFGNLLPDGARLGFDQNNGYLSFMAR